MKTPRRRRQPYPPTADGVNQSVCVVHPLDQRRQYYPVRRMKFRVRRCLFADQDEFERLYTHEQDPNIRKRTLPATEFLFYPMQERAGTGLISKTLTATRTARLIQYRCLLISPTCVAEIAPLDQAFWITSTIRTANCLSVPLSALNLGALEQLGRTGRACRFDRTR